MSKYRMKARLKSKMNHMKLDVVTLYYASKNPKIPLLAKLITVFVVGYALSPIDLIPDFIPLLGYLDDFILLPCGISLAIKLIPVEVMDESRLKALKNIDGEGKKHYLSAAVIIILWILLIRFIVLKLSAIMAN